MSTPAPKRSLNAAAQALKAKSSGVSYGIVTKEIREAQGYLIRKMGEKTNERSRQAFRLLPALNPNDLYEDGSINMEGYVPFCDDNNVFSPWARMVYVFENVGYGRFDEKKRIDIMSVKTFETDDNPIQCPIETVWEFAKKDSRFSHLVKRTAPNDDFKYGDTTFSRMTGWAFTNIVLVDGTPHLAVFKQAQFNALMDEMLRNAVVDEKDIAANPMNRFNLRDITDPVSGCTMSIYLDDKKWIIGPHMVQAGRNAHKNHHMDVTHLLAQRVDLQSDEWLNKVTAQSSVDLLCKALDQWSPDGKHHDHELIRDALSGQGYELPEPPARGYSTGFTAPAGDEESSPRKPVFQSRKPVARPAPAPRVEEAPECAENDENQEAAEEGHEETAQEDAPAPAPAPAPARAPAAAAPAGIPGGAKPGLDRSALAAKLHARTQNIK